MIHLTTISPIIPLHSISVHFPTAVVHILPSPELCSVLVGVLNLAGPLQVHDVLSIVDFRFVLVSA